MILPLVQANNVVIVMMAIANQAQKRRSEYLIDLFIDLLAENLTGFLTAKSSHNLGINYKPKPVKLRPLGAQLYRFWLRLGSS
jgi:hypothetical protein